MKQELPFRKAFWKVILKQRALQTDTNYKAEPVVQMDAEEGVIEDQGCYVCNIPLILLDHILLSIH